MIIDQQHAGQATDASAGIICPWSSRADDPQHYRFGAAGAAYYPELIELLNDLGETEIGYRRTGALCLGDSPADVAAIESRIRQRRDDHPEAGDVEVLSPAQAQELFPPLSDSSQAVYVSGGGRVDGRMLRGALLRTVCRLGGSVFHDSAGLLVEGDRVTGVRTADAQHGADLVVVAGGSWSTDLLAATGVELALIPQRGQISHLDLSGTDTSGWPVVQPPNRHYLVPFDDCRVVAGATRESDSGYDYRVTAGGVGEILHRALTWAPGLAQSSYRETRVGFRPISADGLPYLGRVPAMEGIAVSTGFGATGLTMAPFAGKLIADLALGRDADGDLAGYAPGRAAPAAG